MVCLGEEMIKLTQNFRLRGLASGITLLAVGVVLLWSSSSMDLSMLLSPNPPSWQFYTIAAGVTFLIAGLVTSTGGFMLAGTLLTGIGVACEYLPFTGGPQYWSLLLPAILGFNGLGLLLSSLVDQKNRNDRRKAVRMITVALSLAIIFYSMIQAKLSLSLSMPVVMILIGVGFLAPTAYQKASANR